MHLIKRLNKGALQALLRLYEDLIKALLKLYQASISLYQVLLRLSQGSNEHVSCRRCAWSIKLY
jgi:hypothetical protein